MKIIKTICGGCHDEKNIKIVRNGIKVTIKYLPLVNILWMVKADIDKLELTPVIQNLKKYQQNLI